MKKLNLGCGEKILQGYVNIDIVKTRGIDVVHNLDNIPYPFKDEEFDEIYADNVLEHLNNFMYVMDVLHRILKLDGKLIIKVPHFTSHDAWAHPQHKREFTYDTFDFFVRKTKRNSIDGRCFTRTFKGIKKNNIRKRTASGKLA